MSKLYIIIIIITLFNIDFIISQNTNINLTEINFSNDSDPDAITLNQNKLFFSAHGIYGRELYMGDLQTNKTNLVKDIAPGYNHGVSNIEIISLNDIVLFNPYPVSQNSRLWRSDGTEAGTYIVKDINPSGNDEINKFTLYNNVVYFAATDGNNGNEIWRSDGTESGTYMLKNIASGYLSSTPTSFFVFNNYLYFAATTPQNGCQLWKTDGTEAGTQIVKIINPNGSALSGQPNFLAYGNNFYFYADNGITGFELWKSDGTESNTTLVKDIYQGSSSSAINLYGAATGNYFLFSAKTSSMGMEIWKSDGTHSGTQFVANLNPNHMGSSIEDFISFNNKIYFLGKTPEYGKELWVSDGTLSGTQLLKDIFPGTEDSNIYALTATENYIYFAARSNYDYRKLWQSDGTSNGTIELFDVYLTGSSAFDISFVEANNRVYFPAGEYGLHGSEIWSTDGTTNGTRLSLEVNTQDPMNGQYKPEFTPFNDNLIFVANDGLNGYEPYITDGTINGTRLIKDLSPGDYNSISIWNAAVPSFTVAGNKVYFRGIDHSSNTGYEIFVTDGTSQNTHLLKNIAPGNGNSITEGTFFISYGDLFLFKANNMVHGEELWRSDGTESGTYILKDINVGGGSSILKSNYRKDIPHIFENKLYAELDGYLYFSAHDGVEEAVWKTDGTTANTFKVISIPKDNNNDINRDIIGANTDKIFITTMIGQHNENNALWASDGTQENTELIGIFSNLNYGVTFNKTITFNNLFFFVGRENDQYKIFITDGTSQGTYSLEEIPLSIHNVVHSMSICGSYVYIVVGNRNNASAKEIWRTDGTPEGTSIIEISSPYDALYAITCLENYFIFHGSNDGFYLKYINDEMAAPDISHLEVLNSDFDYNSEYFSISFINVAGNRLVFGIYNELYGLELYTANNDFFLSGQTYVNPISHNNKLVDFYPNPTKGVIGISTKNNQKITMVEVFDISGRKISTKKYSSISIKYIFEENIMKGLYFLKITMDDNTSEGIRIILNR